MTDRRPFLYDLHVELGAKIVPFGGWEMPLQYATGTVAEHLACRRDAVVFDVSHLGTVRCDGPGHVRGAAEHPDERPATRSRPVEPSTRTS